jgi:hypothetical protein
MPIYNITETKPAILRWDYTVFAQSEEEALEMIQDGKVEAENYSVDEDPFESFDYEIEEEDYGQEEKVAS